MDEMRCVARHVLALALLLLLGCASTVDPDSPPSPESDADVWGRLYESGQRWSKSNTDASALYHERAWRRARAFGPGDARLVRSELAYGEARRRQGYVDEAQSLLSSAARHARELQPQDPELRASVLQSLGLLEVMRGDLEAAEAVFEESALLRVEQLDARTPEAAENIVLLAEAQRRLEKFEIAEKNLLQAAAIYADLGEKYAIRMATIQNNLGLLYQDTGRYADAERLHRQAILSARQERNPHNPNTAIYSRGLADLYVRVDRLEAAEELYRYALGILEKTVGPDNIETQLTRRRYDELSATLGHPQAPGKETFR